MNIKKSYKLIVLIVKWSIKNAILGVFSQLFDMGPPVEFRFTISKIFQSFKRNYHFSFT